MPDLPISAKALPTSASNLMYLAQVAVLTRVITGVLRVLENRPSKQTDPSLSDNEKRQALLERSFVELFGTFVYIGFLHLGQDIVNTCYGRLGKIDPERFKEDAKQLLHDVQHLDDSVKSALEKRFDTAFAETFGAHAADGSATLTHKNLLARVLYGDTVKVPLPEGGSRVKEYPKATLATFKNNFMKDYEKVAADKATVEEAFEAIIKSKPLQEFAQHNNRRACGAIGLGVFLSALIGGSVIQWANDRLVAPVAKQWLNKHYKNGKLKTPVKTSNRTESTAVYPWTPSVPAQLAQHTANRTSVKPLDLMSQAPAFTTVYLPNPKIQPPTSAFAMNALASPYPSLPVFQRGAS